jgi:hypothetical protein
MTHPTPTEEQLEAFIDPDVRAEIGDPVPVAFAATVVYVPLLIVGLVLAIFWQKTIPGPHATPARMAEDIGIGLATGLALVGITWVLARFLGPLQQQEREFRRVLGPLGARDMVLLALLSGVAEEVLFRGVVQPMLGYVATSILFGALHFVPALVFLPWTVFALATGFLFGWMFEARESVIAPTIAHVVVNAINLYLIVSGRRMASS